MNKWQLNINYKHMNRSCKHSQMKPIPKYLTPVLMAVAILLGACRQQAPEGTVEERIPVKTQIVSQQLVVMPIRSSGRLFSKTESKLSFKTGGIIEKIFVDDGQTVEKDQLLARLNLEEISSQVRQAELALQKARRDYERARNLYRDSVATLEQYQDAGTGLELAKSNFRIAQFNLEYSQIRAPSKGKILKKIVEENEIIAPGYPVLFFASTEADWVVRVNLTDKDIVRVSPRDSASVQFDAWRDRRFPCSISEIGNAADPYTGTYEVELLLEGPPGRMVSGLIGKVYIFPSDSTFYTVLPVEAIIQGKGQTATVFVLGQGGTEKRDIRILTINDQGIIVASGLSPGEEVVVDGGTFIREGVPVERIDREE